jgi:hypothetical protein
MRLHRFTVHKQLTQGPKTRYEVRPHIGISFLTDAKHVSIPTKIPQEYFFGSPEQRIEFLRGFFAYQLKSYNKVRDIIEFESRDLHMVRKIQAMVESLGIKTRTEFAKEHKLHRVYFRTNIQIHPKQELKINAIQFKRRFVTGIEKVEGVPCVHIEAEAPFLIGTEGFIAIC